MTAHTAEPRASSMTDPIPSRPAVRSEAWLWALPAIVLGLFVASLFALLAILLRQEQETQRNALARDMQWAEQTIRTHLASTQDFLVDLARETAEGKLDRDALVARASQHVANNPEISHIVHVDADQVVRWVTPYETTAWNAGERLAVMEQTLALQRAGQTGLPAYSMPIDSPDGFAAVELHVPVLRDRHFHGTVVAVYTASAILRHLAPSWFSEKYRLVLETDERVLASNSAVTLKTDLTEYIRLDPPGNGIRLRVAAYSADSSAARDVLLLLIAGLVALMAWSLWSLAAHVRRRVRAEKKLRTEYAFRKAMEESITTGLRAIDKDGRILYVNPAFCRIVGYGAAELVGTLPPYVYWPAEDHERLGAYTQQILAGHSPPTGVEARIRRKDGAHVDVRMYVSPLVDADGRQTGWIGSMIDTTEQKRAEEENRRQQQRLQQTSRLITMGEMASSLAHELNQPLAAIANYCMGCVNRLKAEANPREDIVAAMQKAAFQAERAGKIIRRMRDFVRKSEPRRAAASLAEIVDEAIGFAEIEARKAEVDIRVEVPRELPPVFADKIMIEQVVLNLVKNGIEAMQRSRAEERRLTVSAHMNGARAIELAVADRGHGMAAEQAEKLFQPFYTTKAEGMGMGLAICRSIVEFHNGRLWAEANPQGGCVFRFTLPVEG